MGRQAALGAVVLALCLAGSADAAIYRVQDFYDDEQVLAFSGNCGEADVDYVTAPSGAYGLVLVKPHVGDPVTDPVTNELTEHITNVVQQGNRFAVFAQADPGTCSIGGVSDSRIEFTQRVRVDGHCTTGDENLAPRGGFIGNVVATNVPCDIALHYVKRFRFHGAGVGATFRYRGYRCHVSGHPEAATIRCTASRHRAIRWNVGD